MIKNVFMKSVAMVSAVSVSCMMPVMSVVAADDTNQQVTEGGEYGNVTVNNENAVWVYGSNTDVTIEGDVTNTGNTNVSYQGQEIVGSVQAVSAQTESSVDISGSVSSEGFGVYSYSGSQITVGNGVTAREDAVRATGNGNGASDGTRVDVTGNVTSANGAGVTSGYGAEVTVNGNVTTSGNGSIGAYAYPDGKVTVTGNVEAINGVGVGARDGNVTVTGNVTGGTAAINVEDGGVVTVNGTVQSNNEFNGAIEVANNGNVTVNGNVNAAHRGIYINLNNATAPSTINVTGSVNSDYAGIYIDGSSDENTNVDSLIALLPQIYVYGFNVSGSRLSRAIRTHDEFVYTHRQAMEQALLNNINYYINKDDNVTINGNNSATMKYNTDVLNVTVPEGYELQVSDSMTFERMSDGSYAVRLTNAKGGINLRAFIRAISDATGVDESDIHVVTGGGEVVNLSTGNEETNTGAYGASAGSIVLSSPTAANKFVTTSEGTRTVSRVLTLDPKVLAPEQYKQAVIDNISATPSGTALRIESSTVSVFDRKMIEALAENPTIDVEVVFTYGGQKLRVVIPAGYNVRSLLDSNGYCGYLRLAYLLGSQVVG